MLREQGGIGRRVKVGEGARIRVRPALGVRHQGQEQDRRTIWQVRTAPHDLLERQIIGPDERQPAAKSRELLLERPAPEGAKRSGAQDHEYLPGLGKQLHDVVDQLRIVVDDGGAGGVRSERRLAQVLPIDRCEQERRFGKELRSILARKGRRGTARRHDQVGPGSIAERGADEVHDGLFGCADKPCRADHDLDHVHGRPRALVEIGPEVSGERIERQTAAGERLQHEHLADAGPHSRPQQHEEASQRDASEFAPAAGVRQEAHHGTQQFALC